MNTNVYSLSKNQKYILILVLISVSIYWRWLVLDSFNYGDLVYLFSEGHYYFSSISAWAGSYNSDIGGANALTWKAPFNFVYGTALSFVKDSGTVDKFVVFFPIIFLIPISSYLLVNYIVKSELGAFIGALIFSFNSYIISVNYEGHLLIPASIPYSIFAIVFFIKALDLFSLKKMIVSSIFITISLAYDIRVAYISLFIVSFYWFVRCILIRKINFKYYLIFLFLAICLNLYWIIPNFISPLTSNPLLSREIWGSNYLSILNPLTLTHPFWSFNGIDWFIKHEIDWKAFLFPIFFALGLVAPKTNYKIIIFASLSVLGILLGKQIAQPFGSVYIFLFEKLPGFSGFREGTKFYLLILLGYAIVIGNLVANLNTINCKLYRNILISIIGGLIFIIVLPIQFGYQGGVYDETINSQNHKDLNKFLTNEFKTDIGRVIFIPKTPNILFAGKNFEAFNFSELLNGSFGHKFSVGGETEAGKIYLAINNPNTYEYFINKSINYLLVSRETIYDRVDFYKYYGGSKSALFNNIINTNKYKYSYSVGGYDIFSLTQTKPIIDISSNSKSITHLSREINWTRITAGLYSVKISNLSDNTILNFRTKFDVNWKIYYSRGGNSFFQWFYSYPQKYHVTDDFDNNIFYLDKKYFESLKNDPELNFYIVYRPDLYMYVGIILSALTFTLLLIVLIYQGKKSN